MIMVHGANKTLEQLHDIPLVRPPNALSRWKGIQHGDLVEAIIGSVDDRGWAATDMQFAVGQDGARLAGAFDLALPELPAPAGLDFSLGVLTDNCCERALRLYVGARVEVCNNGLATGVIVLRHKHTTKFDLREELAVALDDYWMSARNMETVVFGLKRCKLVGGQYEQILVEAGRRGLMPWSRLGNVDEEFCHPRFPDEIGMGTSWALLNAFTWVAKRNPPHRQMDQINGFRELLPVFTAV